MTYILSKINNIMYIQEQILMHFYYLIIYPVNNLKLHNLSLSEFRTKFIKLFLRKKKKKKKKKNMPRGLYFWHHYFLYKIFIHLIAKM